MEPARVRPKLTKTGLFDSTRLLFILLDSSQQKYL